MPGKPALPAEGAPRRKRRRLLIAKSRIGKDWFGYGAKGGGWLVRAMPASPGTANLQMRRELYR